MAIVSLPEQNLTIADASQVKELLATIGIEYDRWGTVELATNADDTTVLEAYRDRIKELKRRGGYSTVDIVTVHSDTPGLDEMLNKFNREHWHDEDEVRFTVHGQGLFNIHPIGQAVVVVEVGPGDMIRVPSGTRHWFNLCGSREIRAIRFFQNKSGWTPFYTGSMAEKNYEPVCFGPPSITFRAR